MQAAKTNNFSSGPLHDLESLRDFVVLDVETTGFDSRKNRIIEIGLIRVAGGKEIESFSSYVNPGTPIPPYITELTGITGNDVMSAPYFDAIANRVASFIGDSIVVGHNVSFDLRFVGEELLHCGIRKHFKSFDTLALARQAFPGLRSHKLSYLISVLGYSEEQNHRALDDARWTLKVLTDIRNRYIGQSLDSTIKSCEADALRGHKTIKEGGPSFSLSHVER